MHWNVVSKIKFSLPSLAMLLFLTGCASASELDAEPQIVAQSISTGDCPQVRKTPSAPAAIRDKANPVSSSAESLQAGRKLYQTAQPLACKLCHGDKGDGKGDPDFESTPAARNFTCAPTMNALSDGQLFWIIKNGSPDTSMPAFSDIPEEDVWKLVHYLRRLSKTQ